MMLFKTWLIFMCRYSVFEDQKRVQVFWNVESFEVLHV
jgi:hypothetical protein